MGTLIDATKLFAKVSEILDIPVQRITHHHSLLEVIELLVKEIGEMEEYVEAVHKALAEERDGKPEWMRE
jgi:hypothetical protein